MNRTHNSPFVIDLEADDAPIPETKRKRIAQTSANYKCPGCNLTYFFKEGVMKHLKAEHPSLRVDPSTITNKLSAKVKEVKTRKDDFGCELCGKRYALQSSLARHRKQEEHVIERSHKEDHRQDSLELEEYINNL